MKCPLCGKQVSEDDLFCGNCGYNLLQDRPEEVAPEPVEAAAPGGAGPADIPPAKLPASGAEREGFALPTASEDDLASKGDRSWTRLVAIAIVLFVMLCCCCSAALVLLGWLGEASY